ncbi:MAG TPA: amidohydrolase family protein [Dongiaceae bacterium]|nr:amidohydrolase family protein [Dongiaceae bacterium]
MAAATLLKNVRPRGGKAVDVLIEGGRFQRFGKNLAAADAAIIDGQSLLMLPGLIESHVHLDKTLWGLPWRPNSAGPRLVDRIENERQIRRSLNVSVEERGGNLLRQCIAQGSTVVRSHVDVDPETGLKGVTALLGLREQYAGSVDLQLVVFPQQGILISPGTAGLMEEAIKLGVDAVGGLDPAGIDRDPIGHLRVVFGIAERHGRGVDIHLHDGGELGAWQVERIAEFTKASGLAGRVMIDHAYCLGQIAPARLAAIGRQLADQKISIMTSAPADSEVPPAAALAAMGVTIAAGSDNIRDAWWPYGNGDMLERAYFVASRFDWSKDEDLVAAFETATTNNARALGLRHYGLSAGNDADFVLVDCETLAEAVVSRPRRALVAKRGRIVARDGIFLAAS